MDGVRPALSLQTEGRAGRIDRAVLAHLVLQIVGGVELETGLGGVALQTQVGTLGGSRQTEGTGGSVVEDEVMVVTVAHADLGMIAGQARPEGNGLTEIEGGPRHVQHPAGGDAGLVVLGDGVGEDLNGVPVQIAGAVAVEVKIAVVGQVHQGVGIAAGLIGEGEGIVLSQSVGHLNVQGTGEALLTVKAGAGEDQFSLGVGAGRPDFFMKTMDAAVVAVGAVVHCQRVGLAIELEGSAADAVGHPAHQRANVLILLFVVGQGVEAQHHIPQTGGSGHPKGTENAAVGQDLGGNAVIVGEGPAIHRPSGGSDAERTFADLDHGRTACSRKRRKAARPSGVRL